MPETLDYASPPKPNEYTRCVFPILAFAAASLVCGLASDYACGSLNPQPPVSRADTVWIYGRWVPTILFLRVFLLVYTGFAMGAATIGLVGHGRYAIAKTWRVAVVGGAAFGVFTSHFNPASSVLLLPLLAIPAVFPFAFLRRRSP